MDEVSTQKSNDVISDSTINKVVTTGDWFVTMMITAIPLVGVIMLFVWAFGGGANPNKENMAKAALIWLFISLVIGILFFVVFLSTFTHSHYGRIMKF